MSVIREIQALNFCKLHAPTLEYLITLAYQIRDEHQGKR